MTHDPFLLTILAIETSCDETACAIIQKNTHENTVRILSEKTATSLQKHKATKGIVPEVAAREQLSSILPVLKETLSSSSLPKLTTLTASKYLDAVAITVGPGLVGSLLVGIETAKTLSYVWKVPLIPVNHVAAHPYANFLAQNQINTMQEQQVPAFPILSWVISGGHTQLSLMNSHTDVIKLGSTVDDAVGECLDKCAVLLGFEYPGGPELDKLTQKLHTHPQTKHSLKLPRPLLSSGEFNLSFSGLKSAFSRAVELSTNSTSLSNQELRVELAFELQNAICDVIIKKTQLALSTYPQTRSIIFSGGVSANTHLRKRALSISTKNPALKLYFPPISYCTDNAAMIGAYAAFHPNEKQSWKELKMSLNPS